ncbi:T9SS type A sorting domain-containing protein [candidate division KSB1 bacterium]|nr:T9SS type A sorting domain-containing protein [candidate division KSB1 bacterium]
MNSQAREGKLILLIFLCWLITPGFVYTQDSSQNLHRLDKNTIEVAQKNPSFEKFITTLQKNGKLYDSLKSDSLRPMFDSSMAKKSNLSHINQMEFKSSNQPKVPPRIIHIPVTTQNINQEFLIIAKIFDDKPNVQVQLHFRKGGEAKFLQEKMVRLRSFYQARIPSNLVTSDGIEYFIKVIDADSLISRIPAKSTYFVSVLVPNSAFAYPIIHSKNDSLSKWQIFSIPMKLEKNELKDLFAKPALMGKKASNHRTDMVPFLQNLGSILPGRAFWTIIPDSQRVISFGPAASVPTNADFMIPLQPGWNLIGNPFTFPVKIQHLYRTSDQPVELRTFHGRWNEPILETVDMLKPFEGYAIYNHSEFQDSLLIRPNYSNEMHSNRKYEFLPKNSISWMIQIIANSKNSKDMDNIIGQFSQAQTEWDHFDRPEPPTIGDGVALFFHHPEWKRMSTQFCTDFRPVVDEGDVWDFHLHVPAREVVTLEFKGINELPGQFDIWLVDDSLNISRDLRLFSEYFITKTDTQIIRTFKLVIGKKDFIDEKLDNMVTIPGHFQLAQNYPNPFNPETNIQYSLAAAGEVTLKIFNLVGEEVLTLVDKQFQTAGYYLVTWNGQNELGLKMTSGIYVYQLWVNNFTIARKMVLMK